MGFLIDNQHFIKLKLISDFRNLTETEKLSKYNNTLIVETRERLKTSYQKIKSSGGDKTTFFIEAFEVIGLYESEYLLLSIFYNEHGNSIFNYIFDNKKIIKFKGIENHSFLRQLIEYYQSGNRSLMGFVEKEFKKLINLSTMDWTGFQQQNTVERKYCEFIIRSLKEKDAEIKILKSIYLYTRIWNQYFQSPFGTVKAIFLLDRLLKEFKQIQINELQLSIIFIIGKFNNTTNDLLANFRHCPITEPCTYNNNYKQGYISKRNELNEFLTQLIKFTDLHKKSFQDLFYLLNTSTGNISRTIINEIDNRLKNGKLPTLDELLRIEMMPLRHEYVSEKVMFLERNYYFENLVCF